MYMFFVINVVYMGDTCIPVLKDRLQDSELMVFVHTTFDKPV
jgi:hypothetical protein